jgi:N-acetylneuraminate lyase
MKKQAFRRVVAVHTPMHKDGSLNLPVVDAQASMMARQGMTGVFVGGTTGEGLLLNMDERRKLAEAWITAGAAHKLDVLIHAAHPCIEDARALARHAQEIGAQGVVTIAPQYFPPANAKALAEYCAAIASAAPKTPFYYYHIPCRTGMSLKAIQFLTAAAKLIPNLAGVKYTHEDLMDFGQCLDYEGGRFEMLYGRDEMLLPALALGATGVLGSTYNYAGRLYGRLIEAFFAGDLAAARKHQADSRRMVAILISTNNLMAVGKAVMGMIGVDCGPLRQPTTDLTPDERQKLRKDLEAVGFFEYAGAPK